MVACGAGFAGDRIEPAVEFARSGLVDAVVLECLAERTLIGALEQRRNDPAAGFDRRLKRRLAPLLPWAVHHGVRIVSNLGAANPLAAGEAIVGLAKQLGIDGLRVAVVTGDDLVERADRVRWADPLAAGQWPPWLGVHAYLGMGEIAEAVAEGADVVVTGRTADSALFAGPVAAALDLDDAALAGAMTVGHLLECGGQLTGGNLAASRGRVLSAAELADLGYPLATVLPDGSAEISVLPGKPARIDELGVALQLLYEVHDPSAYLTPDVTLDFSTVRLEQVDDRTVRVHGAGARTRPESLKAVGFLLHPGLVADLEIAYAGDGALARARTAGETMALRLGGLGLTDFRIDHVGVDAVLGGGSRPLVADPVEVRMHVSVRCPTDELAQAAEDELYALTLAGPAGGAGMRSECRVNVEVVSGLVDRDDVVGRVEWCAR